MIKLRYNINDFLFRGGITGLNSSSNNCKILAPVGSKDVLPAAVYSGADYVYLSGTRYGARDFADNFDYDGIVNAINFCHKYNVKVFVTVNISILESEMDDVIDYVFFLYSHGADAVIVQDIGLASVISKLIPDLELHASTQMTIYDYSFTRWLSMNGYSNANISREVPLTHIKSIIDRLHEYHHSISIEVFGHGALCYCYSGQCLMSSFLGGRSGNRGLCAQPCRMRYRLEDDYYTHLSDSNYLLSTKDLCTYKNVKDIVDAGVDCIKIEGRMKSREYVSSSTYAYMNAVNGNASDEDFLLLNLAFNRGLTEGYISGCQPDDVVGRQRSGNQGYPIGRVIKVNGDSITIKFGNRRYPTRIVNGDGLKFELDGESCGMYVSKILSQSKNKITIRANKNIHVDEDAMVYITYSKYLRDTTNRIIHEKHVHKIGLDLEISVNNEMHLVVNCISDMLRKPVNYTSKETFEKATKKPVTNENLNKQLRKTGNTNYTINNITYTNFREDLFMPISAINNIRRELLQTVEKIIQKTYTPNKNKIEATRQNIESFKENHYTTRTRNTSDKTWNIYIDDTSMAEIIEDYDYIDTIYYDASFKYKSIDEYCKNIYDDIVELSSKTSKNIVLVLPQLLLDKDIPHIAEIMLKLEIEDINISVQTDNIGVASMLNGTVYGNNLNIYNNYSIKKLGEDPGFKRLVVSNELSVSDVELLSSDRTELEYFVFGNVQLMLSEDNFEKLIRDDASKYYYLIDKRDNRFRLVMDCYNHSHIYDYRILNIGELTRKLDSTGVQCLSIDARFFNNKDILNILNYYDKIRNNEFAELELSEDREYYTGNFTRGVYKKD